MAAMGLAEWLLAAGGLIAAALVWSWFAHARPSVHDRAGAWQERRIHVYGGYDPAEIHVTEGVPVRLVFRREETAACSERVVFPDLGISATLPAYRDTAIELPATQPGTHPFTCEMEMLHGSLIVDPVGPGTSRSPRDLPTVAA
jgi:Cu+-exporting ATPase